MTLKMGVENMVKHYVPEVKFIDSVDDPAFNQPFYNTWDVLDKSMQEGKDEENGK
jgi:Fe-S cluster biogenesis protein NfuA